jgi:hypothetical protein
VALLFEWLTHRLTGKPDTQGNDVKKSRTWIELQWVLFGMETDGDFWFTAHQGGARDINSSR